MGAALNAAAGMSAYTLTDRGTWLNFANKADLKILVEGDPGLVNRYDVILLDPVKHPDAKHEAARRLRDWLDFTGRTVGHRRLYRPWRAAVPSVGRGAEVTALPRGRVFRLKDLYRPSRWIRFRS